MNFARGILVALDWLEISIQRDRQLVPGGTFHFYNPALFDPAGMVVETIDYVECVSEGITAAPRARSCDDLFQWLFSGSTKLIPE